MVNSDKNNAFGDEIRMLRLKKGLGLRELASRAGISRTYLSYIELGVHGPPSPEKVIELARVLEENPDRLLRLAGHLDPKVREILAENQENLSPMIRTFSLEDRHPLERVFFTFGLSLRNLDAHGAIPKKPSLEVLLEALEEATFRMLPETRFAIASMMADLADLWIQELKLEETNQSLHEGQEPLK